MQEADDPLHDIRRSNATAMIGAGIIPKVVQKRLGHSDIKEA